MIKIRTMQTYSSSSGVLSHMSKYYLQYSLSRFSMFSLARVGNPQTLQTNAGIVP
jgi:hypothetical protein